MPSKSVFSNEKGLVQLVLLVVLIAGLAIGVYLVQKTQLLKSRAGGEPITLLDSSGKPLPMQTVNGVKVPFVTASASGAIKLRVQLYSPLGPSTNPACARTTSSPVSSPAKEGTSKFSLANDPTSLSINNSQAYCSEPTIVDFEISDKTPGSKFVWVEFYGSGNPPKIDRRSAQLLVVSVTPSPSPVATINAKITGAVALEKTNSANENRFTASRCLGKPFKQTPDMKVSNSALGNANWDCQDPTYFFGPTKGTLVKLAQGASQSLVMTPPAGYKCAWYSLYGDRTNESFNQQTCTISFVPKNNADIFAWFFFSKAQATTSCTLLLSGVKADVGKQCGDSKFSRTTDVNKDGVVNSQDVSLVTSNISNIQWCETRYSDTTDPCTGVNVKISGAVALDKTNSANQNRFTSISCAGKPFKYTPDMKINNVSLGNANWECNDPSFYFGPTKGKPVKLSNERQSITITPPTGYKCAWYSLYGDRSNEGFNAQTCTVTFSPKNNADNFIWFFLAPK